MTKEERNFRWAYTLLVELAKDELAKVNETCGENWPAGQSWEGLGPTSRSTFLQIARERAGINKDEFLEGIRSGEYEVDDIYQTN